MTTECESTRNPLNSSSYLIWECHGCVLAKSWLFRGVSQEFLWALNCYELPESRRIKYKAAQSVCTVHKWSTTPTWFLEFQKPKAAFFTNKKFGRDSLNTPHVHKSTRNHLIEVPEACHASSLHPVGTEALLAHRWEQRLPAASWCSLQAGDQAVPPAWHTCTPQQSHKWTTTQILCISSHWSPSARMNWSPYTCLTQW